MKTIQACKEVIWICTSNNKLLYIVKIRMYCIMQRIPPFIPRQNIYVYVTTLFEYKEKKCKYVEDLN